MDDGSEDTDASKYRSLVGGLLYLSNTRPDISFAVGVVSRYMRKPSRHHMGAVKQILRYILPALQILEFYINRLQISS